MLLVAALPTRADEVSHARIVRLSFVEGAVQYRREAGTQWQTAVMNLPIQEGYALRTGNGFAEVEFESGLAIRLANNSSVVFTVLAMADGHRVTHVLLPSGSSIVTANLAHGDELTVSASNLDMSVEHSGRFRVDVTTDRSFVTALGGKVDATTSANATTLSNHQTLQETGVDVSSVQVVKSPAQDAFDKWVAEREQALQAGQNGAGEYLNKKYYTAGLAELSGYGMWEDIPGYGFGWRPYGVGFGWMPFMDGSWSYMQGTGWNWISEDAWGWLPYHFGGWVDDALYGWMWIPDDLMMWTPGNASFVQVGTQVGWIPTTPGLTKPLKNPPNRLAPVVILAGRTTNGTIGAAGRIRVPLGATVQATKISEPASIAYAAAVAGGTGSGVAAGGASIGGGAGRPTSTLLASGAQRSGLRAPAPQAAPGTSAANAPRFAPPTLQAPHSMPAPPAMRTGFSGGAFGSAQSRGYSGGESGGYNGGRTGYVGGPSTGTSGGNIGSAGKSGSSGSTGGTSSGSAGGSAGGSGGGHH